MSSEEQELIQSESGLLWLERPGARRRILDISDYFVRKYRLSSATADDLCQLATMKLLRYFRDKAPQEIENPRAFLFIVVGNEARRLFKKEHGHETIALLDTSENIFSDHFETAQRVESGMLLREVLASLNAEERFLFEHWLNGATFRELGLKLDTSHVTARDRVLQIVEKIKGSLFARR